VILYCSQQEGKQLSVPAMQKGAAAAEAAPLDPQQLLEEIETALLDCPGDEELLKVWPMSDSMCYKKPLHGAPLKCDKQAFRQCRCVMMCKQQ
jgi:hypothetical protein